VGSGSQTEPFGAAPTGKYYFDRKHWFDGAAEPDWTVYDDGDYSEMHDNWTVFPGNFIGPSFWGSRGAHNCKASSQCEIDYWYVALKGQYRLQFLTESRAEPTQSDNCKAHSRTRIRDPYDFTKPSEAGPDDIWAIEGRVALGGNMSVCPAPDSAASLGVTYTVSIDGGAPQELLHVDIQGIADPNSITLTYDPAVQFSRGGLPLTAQQIKDELAGYYTDDRKWVLDDTFGADLDEGFYVDVRFPLLASVQAVGLDQVFHSEAHASPEPASWILLAVGLLLARHKRP
jgi:hypothetical protein